MNGVTLKTTPGPWETSVNSKGEWDVCTAGGGDQIADVFGMDEANEGNAKLISAAPEMLELLERLLTKVAVVGPENETLLRDIQIVVDKARGDCGPKQSQIDFIRSMSKSVADDLVARVCTGGVPENWDGHELRTLLADAHALSAKMTLCRKKGKRRRDYKNTCALNHLP